MKFGEDLCWRIIERYMYERETSTTSSHFLQTHYLPTTRHFLLLHDIFVMTLPDFPPLQRERLA